MTKKAFLLLLDELIEAQPGTLNGTESLQQVAGWDSVVVLGFMALVDQQFSVAVSPMQLVECKTVNDLVALVGDKITP